MELNQEWVSKAQDAFDHSSSNREGIAAAIEAYLAEMFKPGDVQMGEPIEFTPQRDYRKELWIAHWATIDGKTKFENAVCGTQKAVEAFDKFFSEPTHG